ncbi:MAG: hypothetical protein ACLP1X_24650 [Polyangiaceae bacterium]
MNTTTPRPLLFVLGAPTVAAALGTSTLEAFAGDAFRRSSECGVRDVCVADGDVSSSGRCQHLKVLP